MLSFRDWKDCIIVLIVLNVLLLVLSAMASCEEAGPPAPPDRAVLVEQAISSRQLEDAQQFNRNTRRIVLPAALAAAVLTEVGVQQGLAESNQLMQQRAVRLTLRPVVLGGSLLLAERMTTSKHGVFRRAGKVLGWILRVVAVGDAVWDLRMVSKGGK